MSASAHVKGHPIHTMLVPFPIALFVFSLVFELIWLASGDLVWYTVAYYDLAAGILMAVPTAVFGFIDFTRVRDANARETAIRHILANGTAVVLFLFSVLIRGVNQPDARDAVIPPTGLPWTIAFILSCAGVALLAAGGWFGGDLVYRHKVGVGLAPEPYHETRLEPRAGGAEPFPGPSTP